MPNPLLGNLRPSVHGRCDSRFRAVFEAFQQSLLGSGEDGEVGSSCAVMLDGNLVVDLWGGFEDVAAQRPWHANTLVCCWSVSKSLCATLTLMLVDQGKLDLDAPVARYWPEFAQAGKQAVRVRHLLEHSSGLSALDVPLAEGALYDWGVMTEAIERSGPLWEPGSRFGYQNMTYGYLLGELCRRVNGGRRLARFAREDLAGPLKLDWHFALTDDLIARTATVYRNPDPSAAGGLPDNADSLLAASMEGARPDEDYNSGAWRTAQIGSGSSHGNARAMARLYGCLARGGALDGQQIVSPKTLGAAATEVFRGEDPILGLEMRYSTGFEMACPPAAPMGPGGRAFGYVGAGGALGFADPDAKLGFGYSPNFMHMGVGPGRNGLALCRAVFDSLG